MLCTDREETRVTGLRRVTATERQCGELGQGSESGRPMQRVPGCASLVVVVVVIVLLWKFSSIALSSSSSSSRFSYKFNRHLRLFRRRQSPFASLASFFHLRLRSRSHWPSQLKLRSACVLPRNWDCMLTSNLDLVVGLIFCWGRRILMFGRTSRRFEDG